MNVPDFYAMKKAGSKISMMTCYDYTSARIVSQTAIDCLLVGDSVAVTMHGYKDTLAATLDMMCYHVAAVSRGAGNKFIIGDMPFLSYRKSLDENIAAVQALMRAGAHAIKLESAAGNLELVRHLVDSGIPVMGHLGLTPQFVNVFGGFKVQGKTQEGAMRLKQDALLLQEAGCFALVLECVPVALAKEVTQSLSIPTIGIGAGAETDGQVLVFQDMLGLNMDHQPKFVKKFNNGVLHIQQAIEKYITEVKAGEFPQHEHCYQSE